MTEASRKPRGVAASGASDVTWTALVGWGIWKFSPELSGIDATMILGAVQLVVRTIGALARDFVHERAKADTPKPVPFIVRQMAKSLG